MPALKWPCAQSDPPGGDWSEKNVFLFAAQAVGGRGWVWFFAPHLLFIGGVGGERAGHPKNFLSLSLSLKEGVKFRSHQIPSQSPTEKSRFKQYWSNQESKYL